LLVKDIGCFDLRLKLIGINACDKFEFGM